MSRRWRSGSNASTYNRRLCRSIYKSGVASIKHRHRVLSHHQLHLARRNGEAFSASNVHVLQTRHLAPMWRRVRHEQLIEGAKAARQTRRQADQPQQLLLITTELANNRQKIVEIEVILRDISSGAIRDWITLLIIKNILSLFRDVWIKIFFYAESNFISLFESNRIDKILPESNCWET